MKANSLLSNKNGNDIGGIDHQPSVLVARMIGEQITTKMKVFLYEKANEDQHNTSSLSRYEPFMVRFELF